MRAFLLILAVFVVGPSVAFGQTIAYQFADSTGVPMSSFTVAVGLTVNVRVYLTQVTGTSLSNDGGLGSAAVRVTFGASPTASLTATTAAVPPWQFGTLNGSDATSGVLNVGSLNPVTPVSGRIFLGTFQFTGQSLGITSLSTADPNPGIGFDIITFNSFLDLDPQIVGPTNGLITVVPEPATVLLLAAGGLGLCRVLVRRRNAANAVPAIAA